MNPPLTPEQEAVVSATGSFFVQACPGAGKTRAIVSRFVKRASELSGEGVALLSFTNAAIDEAVRRCSGKRELLANPNYVGTFDSFIFRLIIAPAWMDSHDKYPCLIDTWDHQKSAQVILDPKKPYQYFSLEWFEFDLNGKATIVPSRLNKMEWNLRQSLYTANQSHIDSLARKKLNQRLNRGYMSCSEARRQLRIILSDPDRKAELIGRLSARFCEIIVDEVQDCGADELLFLKEMKDAGVKICAVGDIEQGIYEFRGADPSSVKRFVQALPEKLHLTKNFRSTPAICSANCSLRSSDEEEKSGGDLSSCSTPIHLIKFDQLDEIDPAFRKALSKEGCPNSDAVILSHREEDAKIASGSQGLASPGNQFVAIVACASVCLCNPNSAPVERKRHIERVQDKLFDVLFGTSDVTVDEAAPRLGVHVSEIRTYVIDLCSAVDPVNESRDVVAERLRTMLCEKNWKIPPIVQLAKVKTVSESTWNALGFSVAHYDHFPFRTIHAAKGQEFEAVCLVIPSAPKTASRDEAGAFAWIDDSACEPRRVLYVGASRAKRLLCLAVHKSLIEEVKEKLESDGVPLAPPE